ncbi:MAG TPA: hypothetical protein VIF64_17485 [Pyrinomonadaceae bacterium]|jgi:hypothetical protein
MKTRVLGILTMFSLLLVVAASSVHAQSRRSTVTIPFSFNVGEKTLPAGEYTIEPNRTDSQTVWLLLSNSGRDNVLFATTSVWARETNEETKLVFNNYDGQYFLSQIWPAGDNSGRELSRPRSEVMLAKNIHREKVVVTRGEGQ